MNEIISTEQTIEQPIPDAHSQQLKQRLERVELYKQTIEAELQDNVQTAAQIREQITTAKTQYKKKYFQKKFAKIQHNVMQMITALQRMEAHSQQPTKQQEHNGHVHDTTTAEATPA